MVMGARRRGPGIMRRAPMVLLGVILVQIVVAAFLVLTHLPPALQSLHQAVGTLVWLSAVVGAELGRRGRRGRQGDRGETLRTSTSSTWTPSTTSTTS